jgi:two-component system OmpR family response regulator
MVRVVVADDEENVRYIAGTALRLDGWTVQPAATGAELLTVLGTRPLPDLIVLDVMLGDADGFELCRRLRRQGLDTPIVFLTARDEVSARVQGLSIGGDDYLTKPFSVEELVARCRLRVRSAPGAVDRRLLRCADLVLDDDAHVVTRAGARIDLSPTEYRLLRFLLLNQSRVMSRAQILRHVWDHDHVTDGSNVESYVSFLRRKIDTAEPRLLHTVRGFGYVLREK